jgi:hypothetical protein
MKKENAPSRCSAHPSARCLNLAQLRLLLAAVLLIPTAARGVATTLEIDDGDVDALISAIAAANPEEPVVIELAEDGLYVLTEVHNVTNGPNGLPVVTGGLTINGNGATIQRQFGAPVFRIFHLDGAGSDTAFSNLTIRGGGLDQNDGIGAGMLNHHSEPVLSVCVFRDNFSWDGGSGMANVNSNPAVKDCVFEANDTIGGGSAMLNIESSPVVTGTLFSKNIGEGDGGGMLNRSGSHPSVIECRFELNDMEQGGGAIANIENSNPTIERSQFVLNASLGVGGAIYNSNSNPTIEDSLFERNSSDFGGGAVFNSNSNPTFLSTVFRENGSDGGGGIFSTQSNVTVSDCSFEGNIAHNIHFLASPGGGGGMANINGTTATVTSSVFRRNRSSWDFEGGAVLNDETSQSEIGSSSFCANEPDDIAGPWNDLGSNQFLAFCSDTYTAWQHDHFDEAQREDEGVSGPLAEPAGDGTPNLLKYALGLDPWETHPSILPLPQVQSLESEGGEIFLILVFSHPSGLSDIEYDVRLSSDLVGWDEPAVLVSSDDDGETVTRTYRDTQPFETSGRRFMRLEVNRR